MPPAYVRRAVLQDARIVAAMRRAWAEEQAGRSIDDPGFDDVFAQWFERESSQRVVWLAELEGEAVGMLNLLVFTRMPRPRATDVVDQPTQWGYVANVFVSAAHRGQGIGARLVEAATTYADTHGFARVVLSPSPPSRTLYERAGFGPATSLLVRPRPQ